MASRSPESAGCARAWLKLDEGRPKLGSLTKLDRPDPPDEPLGTIDIGKAANRAVLALDALAEAREKQTALLAEERGKADDGDD